MSDPLPGTIADPPAAPHAVLLDVTRIVATRWTGRRPTGIDRVCNAYLAHFRTRARAVVQHRGVIRVLDGPASQRLFDLLEAPRDRFRPRLAALLAAALAAAPQRPPRPGIAYLNVGDTDFDLAAHRAWTGRHAVRAFYFIHDLIPALHPEFSRPHAVRRHGERVRSALRTGAGVIVGSRAVERDLAAFAAAHGLALPPVALAPLAGSGLGAASPPRDPAAAPLFVTVGTIEPRKNHRLLFDAWRLLAERLGDKTPRLVLAGQTGPLTGQLLAPLDADPALRRHITLLPACSDTELAALLGEARAVLMPSLAEGFGLPLIEALEAGVPVIASDLPVFRETGQGLPLLLDPHNPAAWAEAIASLARQGQESADALAAEARARQFVAPRWTDHFAAIESLIGAAPTGPHPCLKECLLRDCPIEVH